MSKIGALFKVIGSWIVANKAKSIIIGSAAAIAIGGTATGIAIATSHEHTPSSAIIENEVSASCTSSGSYDEVIYCSSCDEEIERKTVTVDALGHTEVVDAAVAPTCTQTGLTEGKHCSVCNEVLVAQTVVDALGHNEISHVAKAPTCTEHGWDAYVTCSRCDYSTYAEKPALNHDLEHHDAKAPTCTEIGWDAYDTCKRNGCGYTTYNEKAALNHDLEHHDAKAPTCTEIGWDAYDTCKRTGCGYTTYNEKAALTHDLEHHDAKAPTCTEIGWDAYDTCKRTGCGYSTYNEKAALTHVEIPHDAKAPTCTEIGWDAYVTCSRCDYTTYVEKAALTHDEISHEAKAPTCTEIGWDAYVTCSRCDYSTYAEKPALTHDEISHEAKAPTCTEHGWDAYVTCSRCDYSTYAEKPALTHDEISHEAKAPTCTEIGWDAYVTCSRCDYTTYVEKAKLGHDEVSHVAKAPTCTEIGWDAYVTCSRCDYTTYVEKAKLGHDEVSHVAKAPTCTEIGWDAYVTCSKCDYTTYSEKAALTHDEINHEAKAPTCTEIGWDAYVTCSRCDYTTYVEKPALTHDEIPHDAKAPTCTEIGWDAYVTCSRCDYTTYVEKAALGHDEQSHDAKAPTCTEKGWDAYVTCSRCDYTTYVEKAALGHTDGETEVENNVAPDCTHTGSYDNVIYCSVCDAELSRNTVTVPANGHSFGEWYITKESTEAESGAKRRDCKNCDHFETVIVAPLSHDHTRWETITLEAVAPTCTETGLTEGKKCSRCGEILVAQETVKVLGHNEIPHAAKAPTCTEIGWDAYVTCSRCDYTTYAEKPALTHDEIPHEAKAPTCTEIGWDAYVTCSRCDYTTYVEKAALDHDLEHHDAKAPTCTEIGWDAYVTCSRCDYTTYVEKPALTHDEISHDAKAPTCTEIGWDAYVTCSRCDYTTYVEKVALGHDEQSHDAKAPTCTEIGWDAYVTCSRCDYSTYAEKPALTHNEISHEAKAPTCTEIGWDAYVTCSRCDYTTYSEKAALTHDEISHEAKAPTCTEIGWDAYVTCSRCDYTTYVEKAALTHDEIKHDAKAPTCTEIGWDAYVTCSRCDYTTYVEKAALTHDEIKHDAKAPTCTEIGWNAYVTCSRCDYTTYAEKPALTHDEIPHEAKAPTCTEKGWDAYVTCSRCDYTTYAPIEETGHSHNAVVTKPTCTEKGYTTHTCHCGDTYVDTYVDELGHTEVTDEAVAPTCTNTGLTEGSHCSVCNTVLVEQKTVDKLDHDYSEELICNSTHHYYECKCGSRKDEEKHISSGAATATHDEVCTKCGYVINPAIGIIFKTLSVDGGNVYGKVSSDTEIFSFINEVTAVGGAKYIVSFDISGRETIPTKTLTLTTGDNTVYITEYVNDEPVAVYKVVIRRRPVYTVTFDANGGTAVESVTVDEDAILSTPVTTYAGYTFTGWDYDLSAPIMSDTHITANWKANTDTKYTVEHYLENLDKSDYELVDIDELEGTTDTTAEALFKEFEHFTFNSKKGVISGNIDGDGSLVLKVYYARDTYTVKTSVSDAKGGTVTVGSAYPYGTEIKLSTTVNVGYTFKGYFIGENKVCENTEYTFAVNENLEIVASIEANTNTKYTVEYYLANIESGYTLVESVELYGTTDTTATAEQKIFEHFTIKSSISTLSGNIDGEVRLVLKVYYTRDTYSIKAERNNTKAGTVSGGSTYAYGNTVTLTAITNAGYTFLGWYDGDTRVCAATTFTFTAEEAATYTAKWEANTNTAYKIEYYLENIAKDGYELISTDKLVGTTDTTAEALIKEFEHFTFSSKKSVISGNINGDGSLVLKVYYARNVYKLSNANTDLGSISKSGSYVYGSIEAFEATATISKLGYEFIGWYSEDVLLSTDLTFVFTAEKSIEARFAAKQEMANFNFTSTATTCTITGIKDKTVTEIIVPDYVTAISGGAFSGCSNLESLTIPFVGGSKSATSASSSTLFGYIFGTSSYIGGVSTQQYYRSSAYATYYIPSSLKSVTITGGKILYGAFRICTSLTSVTIPDSVTSIGEYAFSGCSSLASITVPNSVTSIGDDAFYGCKKLVEVINHSSLNITAGSSSNGYVGYYAKEVHTGESKIVNVDDYLFYAFKGVNYLLGYIGTDTELVLPENYNGENYEIYEYAFSGFSSLTSINIPNSVTSIGSDAFRYCTSLTSVTIGDSVTSIGSDAFYNCTSLTSITIPDSVTSIGSSAFYNCDSLTSVTIGKSVTSIGDSAFYSCDSLTSVTIGNSVTSIGAMAFFSCDSLTSINIPNSVTIIGSYAFDGCKSLTSVYITDVAKWCGISFGSSDSNPLYYAHNLYLNGELVTELEIPDSVTSIGDYAFYNCTALEEIYFNAVAMNDFSSSNYVFYNAGKNGDGIKVVIGRNVTKIPAYLFYPYSNSSYSPKITSVEFEEGSVCTSIGSYAFAYCDSLTSVTIPDSVTGIDYCAFRYCDSLTSITIPDSVTSIGYSAFYHCTSLTIYCEAVSQPSEWSSNWNYSNRPVVWGYKG